MKINMNPCQVWHGFCYIVSYIGYDKRTQVLKYSLRHTHMLMGKKIIFFHFFCNIGIVFAVYIDITN